MSEDIDLKIISDTPLTRPALRHLRDTITDALLEAGFQFDPRNPVHRESGNASRYTLYRLPYAAIAAGQGILRPEIQIETAVWPLRLPAIDRPVISFVAEAFNRAPEVPVISCVALVETVAEKFVALTRRAGAELADAGGPRDPTLVRHVYDLHVMRAHYDPSEVVALARTIMLADAKAYGHQFPLTAKTRQPRLCRRSKVWRKTRGLPAATPRSGGTWCTARARNSRRPSPRSQLWRAGSSERSR